MWASGDGRTMNEDDFTFLASLLKRRSGLALNQSKKDLVESRLMPVAARQGFKTVQALVAALSRGDDALTSAVAEAMTTGETSFFRDREPFERFQDTMLPALMTARRAERHLRIWCARCSNGQEPYSLAMMVDRAPVLSGWKVEILATDISAPAIERAREGVYSHGEIMRGLPLDMLSRYFHAHGDAWRMTAAIRNRVRFEVHNLIDSFVAPGAIDIVFCRNVLIYFDAGVKRDVLRRLSDVLTDDGYLVLGAGETVLGLNENLEPLGYGGLHVKAIHPPPFRSAAIGQA